MKANAKIVQWSDAYLIGLAEIDDQHKTLVDLINALWIAIATKSPAERTEELLVQLEQYTITHFAAEETMMRSIGYPAFDSHQRAHRHFVERLQAEKKKHQKGESLNLDILHFLRDWLVNHILADDKAYAAHIANQSKPAGFLSKFFSKFKAA